jgi:hypothetical protein
LNSETSPRRGAIALLGAGCLAVSSVASYAASPAKLVGPDLKPRDVNVQTLRDGVLTYFDNQRNLQAEPVSRFLQLRFDTPGSTPTPGSTHTLGSAPTPGSDPAAGIASGQDLGMVELIDGQRLVGRLIGVGGDGQALLWEHPQLGQVTVLLEQVSSWSRGPVASTSVTPATDQVELLNGDVASGFLEKLAQDQVQLKPQDGSAMLSLPLGNVKSVRLANPRREPASGSYTLWLRDGSRVRAAGVTLLEDRVSLVEPALTMSPSPLEATRVQRLDLASEGRRLVDLADLPYALTQGGEVFGVAWPPTRLGMDLQLRAPMTLAWELPAGARRLTAVITLTRDPQVPPAARAWADCRAVLRLDDQILVEQRLWSQQPSVPVNVTLRGKVLTLELDPGVNGPVMDRVTLEAAAVLVSE